MKYFIVILTSIIFSMSAQSQDVLTLYEGDQPGSGSINDFNWLEGFWTGTGLGGDCDELWLPAVDNAMNGIFRYSKDGKIQFTEYMILEESEKALYLKVKHFNRDLSPWEEKDKWVIFPFIKLEGNTAYFSGITFIREDDKLKVLLNIRGKDGVRTEEFSFVRKNL